MVKISVIIPIYNVESYLNECLDSICNQSFEDIEIICIDDGSDDNSPSIIKDYEKKDSRIRAFSKENGGPGSARNLGLDHAEGEYIYFMDSDDYLDADALGEMLEISEEKDLDLILFKLVNFDDQTKERDYSYSNQPFMEKLAGKIFTYRDISDDLFRMDVSVCTKFFNRRLLAEKRFNESLIFEDNIFFIDYIFDAERIYFLDKHLYNRRVRKNSIITHSGERHIDIIEVSNIIEEKIRKRGLYDIFKEESFISKVNGCHYRYTLCQAEFKELFFTRIKEDFESKNDEYSQELDFKKIDRYSKAIFKNVIRYNTSEAFDLSMKNYHLQNKIRKLKKENEKLKNETLSSKLKKWSPF